MWYRVWALIVKEIQMLWQDKRTRSVLLITPLIQLIIFANAATLAVDHISLGVYNKDNGKYGYEMVQRVAGSKYFSNIIFINKQSQIKPLMDRQKVYGVLVIDSAFSKNILNKGTGQLQLLLDGRRANAAQIITGYISDISDQFSQNIAPELNRKLQSSSVIIRNQFNPNLEFKWFTIPAILGTLLALTGIIVTALAVAREREMGTFDQLLVSPLTMTNILFGKTVPALLVGLLQGTLMFVCSLWMFNVPFTGSLVMFYLATFIYLLAVIGVGLFISSLVKTQQQAILGAFLFVVPAVSTSGFATSVQNMPVWLQDASLINPTRYFLAIVRGIFLRNISYSDLWPNLIPLMIIASITLIAATWFFKRRI